MKISRHIGVFVWMMSALPIFAQHYNVPLNRESHLHLEHLLNASETPYHTGFKPYIHSRIVRDDIADYNKDTIKYYYLLSDLIFRRHAVEVKKPDFEFTMDPLFDFQFGVDPANEYDRMRFKNTRGFMAEGTIAKKLSFHTRFFENQVVLPQYLDDFVEQYRVMPGAGRVKPFKDTIGWDYSASYGYIAFAPNDNWVIQFGNEKNFVGDGYRSMLLSDNAYYYPSLKASGLLMDGRMQYTTSINVLQTLERMPNNTTPEGLFMRKGGTFHYLSYNVSDKLQLGLFEGTIFERVNSEDETRPYHFGYYIPVIGVNTILQGFSGNNNVVVGLNGKYRLNPKTTFYSQLAIDDPAQLRFGWQAGARLFELFNVPKLTLQMEYNGASPYAYAYETPRQNYVHMNQPLAHPLGGNFHEVVTILNYEKHRFYTQAKVNVATWAEDYGLYNYGHDVFQVPTDADQSLATSTNLRIIDLQVGYTMNRHTKMRALFGTTLRTAKNELDTHNTTLFYIALRTNLSNYYYDF